MKDNKKLKVVNFFGGPGIGKSTTATAVFSKMKKLGMKVELVHEVAKDFVWEEWSHIFGEQDYIFAHQHRLIRRLVRHDIEYAVVDSSILLSLLYAPDWYPKTFEPFVLDVFNSYSNINIMLERNPEIPYIEAGRNQTYVEALEKDAQLRSIFHKHKIMYASFINREGIEDEVLTHIHRWRFGT